MIIPKSDLPRVVVVGGGFAGLALARNLMKQDVQMVLLDRHNYHTFQPLLYQVSTSGLEPDSIAYPLRKITRSSDRCFFRLTEVKSISAEKNTVHTSIGDIIYDYLVIATGSKTNFFGNDSIEEHGMWMKTVPQALNIRSLILENLEQATITDDPEKRKSLLNFVLAGAGPTGVELSGAIAELRNHIVPKDYPDLDPNEMNIHLLEGMGRVLPPMSEHASEKAQAMLEELGVKVHLNTMVENYDGHLVKTNTELALKTETFIWSAGVTGAPVEGLNASAMVEKANRYEVNAFNQINGYENIFAIGDIALMATEDFPRGHPMVAQPAIQQGKHLAKNIKRLIKGEPLEAFDYFDKGTMATVGRNRAVVDLHKWKFSGFFAWFVWMFVHLWFLVGFRNRAVTFFNWLYNYVNFDKAARLIIRPFKGHEERMSMDKDKA
ncbi:NAD(P)/FAD-dependent oxidoreductase [Christiangramia sp. OXR-203]|jgi:NADH dehydrogenase|uniref:NAD(P)/FAD-dependent oxidoreductase n=1 Tax=Christiangramia sp. OXR-203 TaxID=3100176 RepID=UPI002AC8D7C6|nr:NAD(P)/FAD-dependent oxidoreductase [Christiangramia sp. OXR-203]WPY97557.1 NAD(P)/FAD-dependent oxidoreductase [Christiangramia sp. OXR-203]